MIRRYMDMKSSGGSFCKLSKTPASLLSQGFGRWYSLGNIANGTKLPDDFFYASDMEMVDGYLIEAFSPVFIFDNFSNISMKTRLLSNDEWVLYRFSIDDSRGCLDFYMLFVPPAGKIPYNLLSSLSVNIVVQESLDLILN